MPLRRPCRGACYASAMPRAAQTSERVLLTLLTTNTLTNKQPTGAVASAASKRSGDPTPRCPLASEPVPRVAQRAPHRAAHSPRNQSHV
eukprot:101066-Pyramimonas_sp.AAC.1